MNPLFKSSKVFTEEDKAEAKRMIVDVYNDLKSKGQLLDYVNSPDNCSSKMSSSIWDSCFDEESSDQESSESIEEELSKYSAKVKVTQKSWSGKLINYWSDQKSIYPKLASVAFFFFTIPATNNASERLFSHCANFYTAKRTSLGPNRLEQLVVIKLNSDLCDDIDLSKPETEENIEESDDEEEEEVEEEEILDNINEQVNFIENETFYYNDNYFDDY